MDDIKILDNILTSKQIYNLYSRLSSENFWNLNCSSHQKSAPHYRTFPRVDLQEQDNVYYPYWAGYFHSLYSTINKEFEKKYNFTLPNNICRIHLGAKNELSLPDFHVDVKNLQGWTIIGYLTPQWAVDWGGHLNVEGQEIENKPGRFVIIKNHLRHNGEAPKQNLPYWKIAINYVTRISEG